MSLYLKTRLFEEPFMIHKALTVPHRIQRWLKKQSNFIYTDEIGFASAEVPEISLIAKGVGTDKSIGFVLTYTGDQDNPSDVKQIPFELFYMRSHTRSDKFTDLHMLISDLTPKEVAKIDLFMRSFLEAMRLHYNGKWVITDQELFSSRLV